MKIVTGHTGEDHVTSADFQALNQGIFGSENYVLEIGNKFAATMPDATHVVIQDGEGVMQGVHFRTERGTVDTVLIDSGATGANRIDLIGARYEKNSSGVENVTWSVVKGTAVSGNPSEPTYNTGDILGGDSPVFFPMFKVRLTGVTPELTTLFHHNGWYKYEHSEHNVSSVSTESSTAEAYTLQPGCKWEFVGVSTLKANSTSPSAVLVLLDDTQIAMNMPSAVGNIVTNFHFFANGGETIEVAVLSSGSGTVKSQMTLYYREVSF